MSRAIERGMTLNQMAEICQELAEEKGFRAGMANPHSIEAFGVYCSNLHGEVSELWEAARAGRLMSFCDKADDMRNAGILPLRCIEEEMADIIIRALDIGHLYGIDIDNAVITKHAFNRTRPHRHGGKLA